MQSAACRRAAPRRVIRSGAPGPAPTKCIITSLLYQNGGKIARLDLRLSAGKVRADLFIRQAAVAQDVYKRQSSAASGAASTEAVSSVASSAVETAALPDGVYTADFDTDSSMFLSLIHIYG